MEPNVVSADADARGGLGRVGTRRGDADDEDEELLLGGGRTYLGDDGDTDLGLFLPIHDEHCCVDSGFRARA